LAGPIPTPIQKEGELNKTEMAQKLARKTGLTQTAAQDVVDAIFSTESGEGIIAVELDAGNKVTISGFGTFATKSRAARKGRNPATGAEISIPARKYAHFAPAKNLKERVSS
jgi:DNA-binding protein HU-beta